MEAASQQTESKAARSCSRNEPENRTMMNAKSEIKDPRRRILLVDDEPGFTRLLRFNLENAGGFAVREVNDPSQAIQAAREFRPEVILLDVVMPRVDGGDVIRMLGRDESLEGTTVIFLTAMLDNRETGGEAVRRADGQLYLSKPVSLEALLRCLRDIPPPVSRRSEASQAPTGTVWRLPSNRLKAAM